MTVRLVGDALTLKSGVSPCTTSVTDVWWLSVPLVPVMVSG